jgi:hypothetical protein
MGLLDRLFGGIRKIAERVGPHPYTPGAPDKPQLPRVDTSAEVQRVPMPAPRVGVRGGPSSLIPGGEVFSDQDPWLSGGEPLIPKDGNDPPRRFQYQPGYNIAISPRSTEAVSFAQLRLLGEATLVRVVIEHIKESLKSHEWDIVTDDEHDRNAYAPDIKLLKEFFEEPDREHAWDEWLGLLIEEVLVPDALTIYKHKTWGGELHSLEIIDGTTIKVLTDTRGFVPNPPAPAYQQYLYGTPKTWYTKDELIYAPRNRRANKFYGFSPVEQIIVKINEAMRRDFYNLAQFSDGNTPAGIATLPKEWPLEKIKQFDAWFNELLAGNYQRRSKLFFGPEGMKVEKFHDDEVFGLFNKYDEWLARITCFTFGISPVPFIAMTNRAVAQELGDVEAEGGVASLKMFIERLINKVIDVDFLMPHLRFNWITDRARLQEKRVAANVEYVKVGVKQIDEVRIEEGLEPLGLPPGLITTAGFAPFAAPTPAVPAAPAAAPGPEASGELPARPDLPDGSRPVLAMARAALQKAQTDELGKWERFALKRLEEGKYASAGEFDAEYLTAFEELAIRKALSKARTKDQIKHLFDTRRASVRALRFEPQNSGDVAHVSQGMKAVLRDILVSRAESLSRGDK